MVDLVVTYINRENDCRGKRKVHSEYARQEPSHRPQRIQQSRQGPPGLQRTVLIPSLFFAMIWNCYERTNAHWLFLKLSFSRAVCHMVLIDYVCLPEYVLPPDCQFLNSTREIALAALLDGRMLPTFPFPLTA